MSEEKEVKLFMTPEEVKEILGEPHEIEAGEWDSYYWYYMYQKPNGYEVRKIHFVDGTVSHIKAWGKEDLRDPENEKVIHFPKSRTN